MAFIDGSKFDRLNFAVGSLACTVALTAALVSAVIVTDANTARDRAVRVACVSVGSSWVNDSCLGAGVKK